MVRDDKVKKLKGILVLVLLLALLASPVAVLASDISGAKFYGLIQVSNNGTAVTNVATTCNISTANLINGGFLNSTANNCAIQSSAGADLPFQPSVNASYPWGLWVPAMGANSVKTDILYTANTTGGEIRYFPGVEGMTTPDDNADFELGDNFTVEQKGWVDIPSIDRYHLDFVRANNDWVSIPDSDGFSFTDGGGNDEPFSITAWVNFDDATDNRLVSKWTAAKFEWSLLTDGGDLLSLELASADGTKVIGRETTAITAYEGEWIHIAATYDATEVVGGIDIYINGVVADDADIIAGAYVGMANNNAVVELGSRLAGAASWYDGLMSEVKVYTADLTPAEVLADYHGGHKTTDLEAWYRFNDGAGNPTDSSGKGHNATANTADWIIINYLVWKEDAFNTIVEADGDIISTIVGGNSVTAAGTVDGEYEVKTTCELALDFERANNDWVSIPDSDGFSFTDGAGNDEPFSILLWMNIETAGGNRVVSKWTVNKVEWSLKADGAANGFQVLLTNSDVTAFIGRKTADISGYQGIWTHVGVTYDGSEASAGIDIYINGVEADNADSEAGAYAGMTNNDAVVELGSRLAGTNEFLDGMLAEVKVYTDNLSATEVLADYQGGHKTTDLEAWYRFNDGAGNPTDSSGNGHNATANLADWVVGPLKIYIDDILADIDVGSSVPNTGDDWTFVHNNRLPYMEYQTISIDGTQVQYIDWEYGTTFSDNSTFSNDATPTFRTITGDADVSAELISFLPISEAKAPAYVLEETVDFIEEVPVIVSEFATTPPAGTFPLAGVIVAVADATDTPAQLPLVLLAGFTIIALSLAISSIMRRYGSGTIFVKIIVIAAIMGVFVALKNFGIDFWMIFVFLIIGVALAMASRHVSWQ